MINKIFKIIHNRFPKFFKLFFFLKYVIAIFLVSIFLFLLIPNFFNYEKKLNIVKDYLINTYGLEIYNYDSVEYVPFPSPKLSIKNINFKIKDKPIFLKTRDLNIFLNIKNIYDYKNFGAKKISLNDNNIDLQISEIKEIFNHFKELKSKFEIKRLNLSFKNKDNSILELKKINLQNYGFHKNKINGEVFKKKFRINFDKKGENIKFKILDTGIEADLSFFTKIDSSPTSGKAKVNLLDNYFKLNFFFQNNKINITDSNLRNKDLSISFNTLITLKPFFEIKSDMIIDKIDKELIFNLNLENLLNQKDIIKKLNSSNTINYTQKFLWNNLIENHILKLDLAHGRLIFLNKLIIPGGRLECKGDSILVDEYPRLNFDCNFIIVNSKQFFKKFSVVNNKKKYIQNISVIGSMNIFNKKINFKKIEVDKTYSAKEEDLRYFKETFERILFKENFLNIFKKEKIKEFILEII